MLIMGCDGLVDFFCLPENKPIQRKISLLKYAYDAGIRGFDCSVCPTFIQAYKQLLKYAKGPLMTIGNPNWICGYELHDVPLWYIRDRIRVTLYRRFFSAEELHAISNLPEQIQKRWFLPSPSALPLSDTEILQIYLNITRFHLNLDMLAEITKIVVFGSDYLEWFTKLGRIDLIRQGILILKSRGFDVLSISHWPSVTCDVLNELDFSGHWVHLNSLEQLIVSYSAIEGIKKIRKPITVFRILSAGDLRENPLMALNYVEASISPEHIVIGMNSEQEIDYWTNIFCKRI